MCIAAISYKMWLTHSKFTEVLRFVQPIAVGIVAYATYTFANKFLKTECLHYAGYWLIDRHVDPAETPMLSRS